MFKKLKFVMLLAVMALNGKTWAIDGNADLTNISGQTINGSTLSANRTWTLAGDNYMSGYIVLNGKTLTIKIGSEATGDCKLTNTATSNLAGLFVTGSGRLIIEGDASHQIIIDGGAVWEEYTSTNEHLKNIQQYCRNANNTGKNLKNALIHCTGGSFSLSYTTIQNACVTDYKGGAICAESSNAAITVTNSILKDCQAKGGGGAMYIVTGTYNANGIVFTNSTIEGCTTYDESGVFRTNGSSNSNLTFTGCHFERCYSANVGGVAHWNVNESYTLTFENCTFVGNIAHDSGGALFNEGNMDVKSCTFTENRALGTGDNGMGGAIYTQSYSKLAAGATRVCTLTLDADCVLEENYARYGGGLAMNVKKCDYDINKLTMNVNVEGATISGNTATEKGGGIYISKPTTSTRYVANFSMTSGKIYGNEAKYGAGLFTSGKVTSSIEGGDIYKNKATTAGGGMYMDKVSSDGGELTIKSGLIGATSLGNANTAPDGGGIYMNGGTITLEGGNVNYNNATTSNGGGIYMNGGIININGGNVNYNNTTTLNGGGIYMNGGTININGGNVSNNKATASGGGVYLASGTMTLQGGNINYNEAKTSGGGVYMNGTMNLASGDFSVRRNTANSVPNNVYLPTDKKITVTAAVNPQFMGIFTQNTSTPIPVMTAANAALLAPIYAGMVAGTMNIFDDKQLYGPAYTSGEKTLYFNVTSPWSSLQQSITEAPAQAGGVYQISNVKDLTAFLVLANGINDCGTTYHPTADPSIKGKLVADIDMEGHTWVPIGTSEENGAFTGTFDGNGHTIYNLSMVPTNTSNSRGMFGYTDDAVIKNVVLQDCNFSGDCAYIGSIVSKMNGGSIINSIASGWLNAMADATTLGGFAGLVTGGGEVKNNLSLIKFNGQNSGGLVGNNAGTVENCYLRLAADYYPNKLYAYSNSGTISKCYAPENTGLGETSGGTVSDCGTYTATGSTPYKYRQKDNLVGTTPLKQLLNAWVNENGSEYANWSRPTTNLINGDYPLLTIAGNNAVAADGDAFTYGDINDLMTSHPNSTIWLYASKENMNATPGTVSLYIDEDAALTTADDAAVINATVGITLDNSAGAHGANPSQGGEDAIDWHFFSSSLSNAPVGINYTDYAPVSIYGTPNVYDFDGTGYFPATDADGNSYYNEWDFYSYYEPQYQWVNFKRNSASHYNMNTGEHFEYTNETILVPGKGYMVALADPEGTYLQCTGTLNNGNVAVSLSYAGEYRKGLNLLGNPYQSYLDFEEFANDNPSIWPSGENATTPYYIIMDEDEKGYLAYTLEQSPNHMAAGRYIHPHQGFMVVAGKSTTATFTDGMRVTDLQGYDAHFRDQQVAYPLVNLIATDANGNRDIATAELGRPDKGGAIVADFATLANCLVYVHYDDKDYRIAFTQPGITSLPVRFVAFENGTYTLTWDMENGEFGYMHLIDNITGTDIDMLTAQEYTFTASTDDLLSRFKLVFAYTGIDEDENTVTNANFAYMSNGQLVVEGEGTLQLIDMNGRVLHQTRLHGDVNTVELPQMAAGLYVLKLDGKTQKIVL